MNFQQFLTILAARKRIALRVFALVVVTTIVISLIIPNSYTAETTVVLDVKNPDPVNGMISQAIVMPSYLATQVDIVTSDRVARRVVKILGFDKVPELVEAWKKDTDGKGTIESYYAAKLATKLDVKPSKLGSNIINISFTGSDPKFAAATANAFAKAYLDISVELTTDPAQQYTDWFAAQAKRVKEKMDKEQEALSAYQTANGIVSLDEHLDVENSRLNDLGGQLTLFQAQKSDAQSRMRGAAKGDIDTNPDVMSNPVIQNLRVSISAAAGKLQEAENTLGKNHPQIKEQRAELDALKERLKLEMANVAASLGANSKISSQKVFELRAALEDQKTRVLELKKQRDEINGMQAELAATQADYNNIRQRLSQSYLQGQSLSTIVSVLTPAYEPEKPSSPKILLNIIVSIFLGGILSVGVAMVMELMDKRVRSMEDLVGLGVQVLGVLTVERNVPKKRWLFWRRQTMSA